MEKAIHTVGFLSWFEELNLGLAQTACNDIYGPQNSCIFRMCNWEVAT